MHAYPVVRVGGVATGGKVIYTTPCKVLINPLQFYPQSYALFGYIWRYVENIAR